MHIDVVPNRTSRPAYLLRETYREGGKVKKRTVANLSALSDDQIRMIRAALKGESLYPLETLFKVTESRGHGHVQAVQTALSKLGMTSLLASRASRERQWVLAMLTARILAPQTKLATTRWWHTTTLAEEFGVSDATEAELYAAMDWLLERQDAIEKKLAARHLGNDSRVFYDLSSSYFEGSTGPLARRGYNRDRKQGTLQVNYGLLTDRRGCPIAVSVYEGNTSDPHTLMPEIERLKQDFQIERLVMVGDRGMISQKAIDALGEEAGVEWLTALKSTSIRSLINGGDLQLDLFDERNLFEMTHADYPGERLVACRNPALAERRAHQRESLLQATEAELEKIRASVEKGRLKDEAKIGVRVGKVVNRFKVAKHFELDIRDGAFAFQRNAQSIATEARLDGIYVIRTSVSESSMDAAECVRQYKALSQVERAFRTMKGADLRIRPIHHRLADRVRAHILLCVLAYYVEWHMREAWRERMFADEDPAAKAERDPLAPAKRSGAAEDKARSATLADGTPVHSFSTLLQELSTLVRNTCQAEVPGGEPATFFRTTEANAKQQQALDLLRQITL
jgi:transposase